MLRLYLILQCLNAAVSWDATTVYAASGFEPATTFDSTIAVLALLAFHITFFESLTM